LLVVVFSGLGRLGFVTTWVSGVGIEGGVAGKGS
jgi:hypothetical protein